MNTKFDTLLTFPCQFSFKVLGLADPALPEQVLEVIQRRAPGNYTPIIRPSKQGNYHAVTVTITATDKAQLETLYQELGALALVKVVL